MSEEVTDYIEETQEPEQIEETQEPEQEQPKEETEQEKYSKRVQKRIDKLEWEKNEERRRAYALEQELEQLRSGKQQQKQPESHQGQPSPDDFPAGRYDPDYLVALTEYKIQQSIDNLQKSANVSEQRKLIELQQEQARQTHDDYDDVTAELLEHPLANDPVFNEAILSADNVASVAYYLGKNPDELENLAAIRNNPSKMLKAIGRIEAKLESQPTLAQQKKAVSNAPKPVSPVGSAKPEPSIKDPSNMTQSEYIAWRQGQKRT